MGKKYFRIVDWMLSIILVIIMLFISSSVFVKCALGRGTEPISIPYGVWHSEAPNMTLYINPAQDEIDSHYPGEVYWDGDIIKVVAMIDRIKGDFNGNFMEIINVDAITESGVLGGYPNSIFNGSIRIRSDAKMEYTLLDYWAEQTGYKTIVFELIDTYDVPESSSESM